VVDQIRAAGRADLLPVLEARLESYRNGTPVLAPWLK